MKKASKKIMAWHFLHPSKRLGYGDDRLVQIGKWLEVPGKPECCRHGLHASLDPADAAYNADEGNFLACRVELAGEMDHRHDKISARRRKVLWWVNVKSECQKASGKLGWRPEDGDLNDLRWHHGHNLEELLLGLRKKQLAKRRTK